MVSLPWYPWVMSNILHYPHHNVNHIISDWTCLVSLEEMNLNKEICELNWQGRSKAPTTHQQEFWFCWSFQFADLVIGVRQTVSDVIYNWVIILQLQWRSGVRPNSSNVGSKWDKFVITSIWPNIPQEGRTELRRPAPTRSLVDIAAQTDSYQDIDQRYQESARHRNFHWFISQYFS